MATALLRPEAEEQERPATPFHLSASWARCWSDAYGKGQDLILPIGEARLHMVRGRDRLGPLAFPLLASATNLQTCYFDPEGDADAGDLEALPQRLLGTGAAQVRIDWLEDHSPLLAAGRGWTQRHLAIVEPFALSPLVDCRHGFDDYLARAGSSVRKYWKACRRHILNGPIEFKIVTGGPALPALIEEMFALEAAGWKGREGSATLSVEEDALFYRALACAATEAGALRIATLREEGRLIAYEYCVVSAGTVLAMKVAYDESRSRLQPGHLAAVMNIRDACADPSIAWYDMLGNGMRLADYKKRFATDYRTVSRIRLFARTPMGRLLYALYRMRPHAKALANRLRSLAGRRIR